MSETDKNESLSEEPSVETADVKAVTDQAVADPTLRLLLGTLLLNPESSFSLTVTVPGATVTGLAVGPDRWAQETHTALEHAGAGGSMMAMVTDAVGLDPEMREVIDNDLLKAARFCRYVHMIDASFVSGPHIRAVGPWRGRLMNLSSWSFGETSND